MKAWIAEGYESYEGSEVLGAYSTEAKALDAVERHKTLKGWDAWRSYIVNEFEIDVDGMWSNI